MSGKQQEIETYIRVASMCVFPSYIVWKNEVGITIDADWLGVSESQLDKELRKAGGGINVSGLYPSPPWLEKLLRTPENLKRATELAATKEVR